MLTTIIIFLLILVGLFSLPLTFLVKLRMPGVEKDDEGVLSIYLKYLGITFHSTIFPFKIENLTMKLMGELKEDWKGSKWSIWIWQNRGNLWNYLSWYRFSILSPPFRVTICYGVGDPAKTGMICGYLAALIGIVPPSLVEFAHYPDFVGKDDHIYGDFKVTIIPVLALIISLGILIRLLPSLVKGNFSNPPVKEAFSV